MFIIKVLIYKKIILKFIDDHIINISCNHVHTLLLYRICHLVCIFVIRIQHIIIY